METIVSLEDLSIDDKDIVAVIEGTQTQYVNMVIKKDYDNKFIIVANIVPYYIESELSKSCVRIFNDKGYYFKIPDLLLPFIGKKISYYRDKSIFSELGELFRIKPLNFKLEALKFKKVELKKFPYFTKSGSIIIPKFFVNTWFHTDILLQKISFDNTDFTVIKEGFIYTYLFPYHEKRYFDFRLKQTCMGLSTGCIERLKRLVEESGKKIENFKYTTLIKSETYPHGFMIFKENKYGKRTRR